MDEMDEIDEIESIINDGDKSNTDCWDQDCAIYLKAIAKTQLLILIELRKHDKAEFLA